MCLIASLAAGGVYLALTEPVYEAKAKLRIGQVGDSAALEDPEIFSAWLLEKYGEDLATDVKRKLPFIHRASAQKGSKLVVEVSVHGETPEQAARFLQRVVDEAVTRHGEIHKKEVDLALRRIAQIENQRQLLLELFEGSGELLDTLRQRDPIQASLLMLERGRVAAEIGTVDRELPGWLQRLNPPQTVMTELLGEVTPPASAVSPRKALVIVLAALLGLTGGIFAAVAAEWWLSKGRMGMRHTAV